MSIEIHDQTKKVFVVAGASHSATSLVSKGLQENGINMHVPKGEQAIYYEDLMFVELNKRIIENAGGGDFDTPPHEKIIAPGFEEDIKIAIKTRDDSYMWGWKDPRNAFTAQKYFPYLEGDVYFIACFRKPQRTVDSWNRRYLTHYTADDVKDVHRRIIKQIEAFSEL